jgi:hypothetical protein
MKTRWVEEDENLVKDDNWMQGLILRNSHPPTKKDLFTVSFSGVFGYFAGGVVYGAILLLISVFLTGARADYYRWMSVVLVVVFPAVGLLRTICVGLYMWFNRRKLRFWLKRRDDRDTLN